MSTTADHKPGASPRRRYWRPGHWYAIALGSAAFLHTVPGMLLRAGNQSISSMEAATDLAESVALILLGATVGSALGSALGTARLAAEAARDQADVLLTRIAPALERLDDAPASPQAALPQTAPEPRVDLAAQARAAIAGRRWAEASARLEDLLAAEPTSPVGAMLAGTLDRAKAEAAVEIRGALDAARSIGDAFRVMDLRHDLAPLLAAEPRLAFDKDLVGWLMAKVRRGLADLPVQPDVVTLANRVAEEFASTAEGASLRRALPVLRRTVGLCPRCAKPYIGVDDACPECLAGVVAG